MTASGHPLATRFRAHLAARFPGVEREGLAVALSGGADSVVLLHLLRFPPHRDLPRPTALHVDHRMRPGGAADAEWVRGLCRAWDVPLRERVLDPAPATEAEARTLRYAALDEMRGEAGVRWVATAHHADDQAETVLFRAVRGTGLPGLRGVRSRRGFVLRPLLPFTRDDLRAYAQRHHLGWREDPTNRLPKARNVLRHEVLPLLERSVAPDARGALARLGRRAALDEAAWRSLEPGLLEAAGLQSEPGALSLDRDALSAHHPAVQARLIRALARRLGRPLREAGTRRAVEFTRSGASGRSVPLGGGLRFGRALERVRLTAEQGRSADGPTTVALDGPGVAVAQVGGVRWRVRWTVGDQGDGKGGERFTLRDLALPLTVRGWSAGDRIRLPYGSKKLKKLFLEARLPRERRHQMPVVVDAAGRVLWVPGVARAAGTLPREDEHALTIAIDHAPPD